MAVELVLKIATFQECTVQADVQWLYCLLIPLFDVVSLLVVAPFGCVGFESCSGSCQTLCGLCL